MSRLALAAPCSFSRTVAGRCVGTNLVASPDAIVLPDGSVHGIRPPQLPDRGTAPAPAPSPAPG